MILDARSSLIALDRKVKIAIVGAGACGLTLARELSDIAEVLLIESGGLEAEESPSDLQKGQIVGLDYPLETTRERRFGGSTYLWAGYCALFDENDFVQRSWVPDSGWPISYDEVASYYPQAAHTLNVHDGNFDASGIIHAAGDEILFDDQGLSQTVWRFGSPIMRFGDAWQAEFQTRSNPTILTHANMVDIRMDLDSGRVKQLVISTTEGRVGRIEADVVVLACGGIETARLLLNANSQIPEGVGNSHDLVGRYFMEHPHWTVPGVEFALASWHRTWTGRGTYGDGCLYARALGLSKETQARLHCLNARAHVFRTPDMQADAAPRLGLFMEQAPNPSSRVMLDEERDSLGLRRVRLDWRLTELDRTSAAQSAEVIRNAFSSRVEIEPQSHATSPRDPVALLHSNHHLGTTRMSDSSRYGVVNTDCRLHDVANCYAIGGSVFPTVSWANPTMTVLALTYRLGAHLRKRLAEL